jgi:hypothetical protein
VSIVTGKLPRGAYELEPVDVDAPADVLVLRPGPAIEPPPARLPPKFKRPRPMMKRAPPRKP